MTKAGLDPDIVIASIHSNSGNYDTSSPDALIALKNAHVPAKVIKEMMQVHPGGNLTSQMASATTSNASKITDPVPANAPSGVYLVTSNGSQRLMPFQADTPVGGMGMGTLTYGAFKSTKHITVPGHAEYATAPDTACYLFLKSMSDGELANRAFVQANGIDKKGNRIVATLKTGFGVNSAREVDDSNVGYTSHNTTTGVKLVPNSPLQPGYYALRFNLGLMKGYQVYVFQVTDSKASSSPPLQSQQ